MVDPLRVGLLAQIASGVALLALSGLLLAARPRRPYTVAFGCFLALWGGFVICGNLGSLELVDGQVTQARRWLLAHASLLVIAYLPLAYFGASFLATKRRWLRNPLVVTGLLAPAIVGGLAMNLDPNLFHRGFLEGPQGTLSDWGPLYPVFSGLFWLTLFGVLAHLALSARRSSGVKRRRTYAVLLALALYAGFESTENLVLFGWPMRSGVADAVTTSIVLTSVLGVATLAAIALALQRSPLADGSARLPSFLPVVGLAAGFGLLSGASSISAAVPPVLTLGLWRLAAGALLAYAILRYELFSLENRAAHWTGVLGLLAVALGAILGLEVLLEAVLGSAVLSFTAIQILLLGGLAIVLTQHPGGLAWLRRALQPADPSARSLEVYENALLEAHADPATRGQEIVEIRQRLGISEEEHRVLDGLVRGVIEGRAPELEPGLRLDDRYRVEAVIGEGGVSQVLRAHDHHLDRTVALKVLHPLEVESLEDVHRFLREARLSAHIEHPNVIRVYDVGAHRGLPFLVMEHLPEGSLRERLLGEGRLDRPEAARVLASLLAGLEHLHSQGLLHRDLKPGNVLLSADGEPRIADLGLATRFVADGTQTLDEPARTLVGTPAYMAPERLAGRPATPRSDVYAAGAILYEVVNGEPYLPLEHRSIDEVRQLVAHQPPRPPSAEVPRELRAVWERALAKDPEDRFRSAAEMREALLDAVAPGRREGGP